MDKNQFKSLNRWFFKRFGTRIDSTQSFQKLLIRIWIRIYSTQSFQKLLIRTLNKNKQSNRFHQIFETTLLIRTLIKNQFKTLIRLLITIWIRIDSTQSLQKLWTTLWSNFWYDFLSKTLLNRLDQFLMELNFKRTLFLNLQLIWELNFDQNRFNSVSSKTLIRTNSRLWSEPIQDLDQSWKLKPFQNFEFIFDQTFDQSWELKPFQNFENRFDSVFSENSESQFEQGSLKRTNSRSWSDFWSELRTEINSSHLSKLWVRTENKNKQ